MVISPVSRHFWFECNKKCLETGEMTKYLVYGKCLETGETAKSFEYRNNDFCDRHF